MPADTYLRKLRTYLSPGYWRRVIAVHGVPGVGAELARILGPAAKNQLESPGRDHVDFSTLTSDPDEALRLARATGGLIIPMLEVPLSSLRRNHLGISIADPNANPFTRSVTDYLSGESTEYAGSVLNRFYESWQPRTLAEFVGVNADGHSSLSRPLIVGDMPWDEYRGVDQLLRERDVYELERLAKFGHAPSGRHGYDYFGPISKALGEYRFKKHCRVARQIVDVGFDPADHLVDVQLLVGDGAWALLVRDGKHRTTGLAAIGVQKVRVSLPGAYPVIRRDEVAVWPGVHAGLYSVEQALEVFDRHVKGEPPIGWPDLTTPRHSSLS